MTNSEKKPQPCKPDINDSVFDDSYLAENIKEARTNHDKACEIYRNYVGSAQTIEERLRRINAFRRGGH